MMDKLTRLEGRAAGWLVQDYRQRAEREAIERAHARFARCYRRWANSLFDLQFLLGLAPGTLASSDARPLAHAYVAQFVAGSAMPKSRLRQVQMALPAATAFLQLLAQERLRLHQQPE